MKSLTDHQILLESDRLDQAELSRQQIPATTVTYPNMTIDDAYLIQNQWIQKKLKSGRSVVGHKVGLTSRVMQKAMSIDEPDFGVLLDDMVFENNAIITVSDFLDLRIEVETAFVLNKDIDPSTATVTSILDSTDYIVPALELIAARSFRINPDTGYKRTVRDTIADNAANAGIILGSHQIPLTTDLSWMPCMLYRNGIIEQSGVSGAVLGHPAKSVVWLAKKYAEFGRVLKAGQVVLAGSFTSPIICRRGDKIVADFNSFGKVSCSFK